MTSPKRPISALKQRLKLSPVAKYLIKPWKRTWRSETSKCRVSLSRFCLGDGVDVGFGGDPIVPNAICMDLEQPYAKYKRHPQHLHGSADNLHWFASASLDWLYSSHVLEDFVDTGKVLDEWIRVVRPGGHIVLFLPDEPTYRAYCESKRIPTNVHHIHANFGPGLLRAMLAGRKDVKVVHENFPVGVYSFEFVLEKTHG